MSGKTQLPGHRKRLRFVRKLKRTLGPRLEIFGRSFRGVAVKADAILPYKYQLVLENTVEPSYWSEKTGDAWLGYAFPIVSGPPDLDRWFPPESFLPIDIDRPEDAIAAIKGAMRDGYFEKRFDAILEARRRLLLAERLCQVIARAIAAHPSSTPRLPRPETILPMARPGLVYKIQRETSRLYWQLDDWVRARLASLS
jgi:hypothetical protein